MIQIEPMSMCVTWNDFFVEDGQWLVRHEKLDPGAKYEYGYTCTCPAFKFGRGEECKHIKRAKEHNCLWHQQFDGGEPTDERKCPECGAPVVGIMVAV